MTFTLPEPRDVIDLTMTDGAVIRVRRHGPKSGRDGATRLFVSHGNGFAADAYYPFWGPLAEDFELFVFDVRNHGWNDRTPADGHRYQQIAQDLLSIHQGIDEKTWDRKERRRVPFHERPGRHETGRRCGLALGRARPVRPAEHAAAGALVL